MWTNSLPASASPRANSQTLSAPCSTGWHIRAWSWRRTMCSTFSATRKTLKSYICELIARAITSGDIATASCSIAAGIIWDAWRAMWIVCGRIYDETPIGCFMYVLIIPMCSLFLFYSMCVYLLRFRYIKSRPFTWLLTWIYIYIEIVQLCNYNCNCVVVIAIVSVRKSNVILA